MRSTIQGFLVCLLAAAGLVRAQDIKLPAPQMTGGKPLMEALSQRQSTREFTPAKLPPQVLSNLLWAAWGINRGDGRRTAPSSSNHQDIEVYVLTADGAFTYDAKANALQTVLKTDVRKQAGVQPFVAVAPLTLVYVSDISKLGSGEEAPRLATANADTGFIAQNVYLFCASEGLGAVVRGSVSRPELAKTLNLRPDQRITLAQTVGYIKK